MRQNFSTGQETTSEDLNTIQSRLERGIYDRIIYELMGRKSDAFFKDSFLVSRVSALSVLVKAGLGFQVSDTGSKYPVRKPVVLDADASVNIDTPDPTNPRIDLICVKSNRFNSESENRKFKDEFTDAISTQSFVVATDWKADVLYVAGTPAGSPVAPATPSGYIKVATLTIDASTGIPVSNGVADNRSLLPIATGLTTTGSEQFDAIVGTVGTDQGATYSSLKAALDNAVAGWKILVLRNETINTGAVPDAALDNIEIVFKSGVTFTKGTSVKGLILSGDGCKIHNGRFLDFSTAADIAIDVTGEYCQVAGARFKSCDTNIKDNSTHGVSQYGIITEV